MPKIHPPECCYIVSHKMLGLFLGFYNGMMKWSTRDWNYGHGIVPALPTIEHCHHWIGQSGYPVEDFQMFEMPWRGDNMFHLQEVLSMHYDKIFSCWVDEMFRHHVHVFHETVQ